MEMVAQNSDIRETKGTRDERPQLKFDKSRIKNKIISRESLPKDRRRSSQSLVMRLRRVRNEDRSFTWTVSRFDDKNNGDKNKEGDKENELSNINNNLKEKNEGKENKKRNDKERVACVICKNMFRLRKVLSDHYEIFHNVKREMAQRLANKGRFAVVD